MPSCGNIAIFPGTFDPPTLGHLNLIERGATLVDHLIVLIGKNSGKESYLLSPEERKEILSKHITSSKVEIVVYEGLTAEFAKKRGATFLLRGIRSTLDLEYELTLASINRKINGIETLFLPAEGELGHISSSLIKEMLAFNGPLEAYLPVESLKRITSRICCKKRLGEAD